VATAIQKIGYELSDDDVKNVYDEIMKTASKKAVGTKELDTIIASVAMQVPSTYKIKSFVINSGDIITPTANVELYKNNEVLRGFCIGDGPIDAAFLAIEKITGHHYELDDFQIKSVTQGFEAMGSAVVKLRHNGKIFSGSGISTDIVGASIYAYISALNKITYEEGIS
jgi:2-isopropylmalate synthase